MCYFLQSTPLAPLPQSQCSWLTLRFGRCVSFYVQVVLSSCLQTSLVSSSKFKYQAVYFSLRQQLLDISLDSQTPYKATQRRVGNEKISPWNVKRVNRHRGVNWLYLVNTRTLHQPPTSFLSRRRRWHHNNNQVIYIFCVSICREKWSNPITFSARRYNKYQHFQF